MPLYEYVCRNCGKHFEVLQKFSDDPLKVHEECGGGPVERLLSPPALQFKGSGWYITDYARSGSSTGEGKGGDSKRGEAKGGGEKTESKGSEGSKAGGESAPASKPDSSSSSKPASTPAQ